MNKYQQFQISQNARALGMHLWADGLRLSACSPNVVVNVGRILIPPSTLPCLLFVEKGCWREMERKGNPAARTGFPNATSDKGLTVLGDQFLWSLGQKRLAELLWNRIVCSSSELRQMSSQTTIVYNGESVLMISLLFFHCLFASVCGQCSEFDTSPQAKFWMPIKAQSAQHWFYAWSYASSTQLTSHTILEDVLVGNSDAEAASHSDVRSRVTVPPPQKQK